MTSTEHKRILAIIEDLRRHAATPMSGLVASVGVAELDDCAVIPIPGYCDLIIGSDFVRGENFTLAFQGLLSASDVGYYLIGANVSDLAAMGAKPIGVTVIYRYTNGTSDKHHKQVMHGIITACHDMCAPLLGGDSGEYQASVLSATAIGICASGRALLRSKGQSGDLLFLTGSVGLAGAALQYFTTVKRGSLPSSVEDGLLQPWRKVSPALPQAAALVEHGLSACAIDTSDGLKTACKLLAAASHLDVILDETSLPIHPYVRAVARILACDPVALTCGDSVDFRLLFSVPERKRDSVVNLFAHHGWELFQVGHFAAPLGLSASAWMNGKSTTREIPGVEKS